jgi:hypothetical protein
VEEELFKIDEMTDAVNSASAVVVVVSRDLKNHPSSRMSINQVNNNNNNNNNDSVGKST